MCENLHGSSIFYNGLVVLEGDMEIAKGFLLDKVHVNLRGQIAQLISHH